MSLSSKKLYYRRGDITYSCNLYTTLTELGSPTSYFAIRAGDVTLYAREVSTGAVDASHLRVFDNGIYAIQTAFGSIPVGTYQFATFVGLCSQYVAAGAVRGCTGNITNYGNYTYNLTSGSKVFASGMSKIFIRPKTATWTSAMTDALLIDLLTVGNTWTDEKTVDLRGNCGARTVASDAAVATLTSYGVTVLTN